MQDTTEQAQDVDQAEIVSELPAKQKPEAMQLDERGIYKILTQADEYRVAQMLMRTGAVPKTFNKPEQVMMAIQALKSLGLNWRTALRQCGFNKQGAFIVYGDLELAVVRQSGQLEDIHEFLFVKGEDGIMKERSFANSNLDKPADGAVCVIKRKGHRPHEASYTIEDAKISGLWGKTATWIAYPQRMMQMRARGVAIRNTFSDVTQGLGGHEYDVEGIEYDKK